MNYDDVLKLVDEKGGPRALAFRQTGMLHNLFWDHLGYPEQSEPAEVERDLRRIETEDLEKVFDRWCRGQNLPGFASSIISALDAIRKVVK